MNGIRVLTFALLFAGLGGGAAGEGPGHEVELEPQGRGRQGGHHAAARHAGHRPSAEDLGGPRPDPRRHPPARRRQDQGGDRLVRPDRRERRPGPVGPRGGLVQDRRAAREYPGRGLAQPLGPGLREAEELGEGGRRQDRRGRRGGRGGHAPGDRRIRGGHDRVQHQPPQGHRRQGGRPTQPGRPERPPGEGAPVRRRPVPDPDGGPDARGLPPLLLHLGRQRHAPLPRGLPEDERRLPGRGPELRREGVRRPDPGAVPPGLRRRHPAQPAGRPVPLRRRGRHPVGRPRPRRRRRSGPWRGR